jgi:hypothetical protein
MLIVDYQSKSYYRFLTDMLQIANIQRRYLITFNGANNTDLMIASEELTSHTNNRLQHTNAIGEKASADSITALFNKTRESRDMLLFEQADLVFDKKTAVKNAHERDSGFDLNHLFKHIAKHNGVVILATEKKQILSAAISTKMDVVVRFNDRHRTK